MLIIVVMELIHRLQQTLFLLLKQTLKTQMAVFTSLAAVSFFFKIHFAILLCCIITVSSTWRETQNIWMCAVSLCPSCLYKQARRLQKQLMLVDAVHYSIHKGIPAISFISEFVVSEIRMFKCMSFKRILLPSVLCSPLELEYLTNACDHANLRMVLKVK